MLEYYLSLALW